MTGLLRKCLLRNNEMSDKSDVDLFSNLFCWTWHLNEMILENMHLVWLNSDMFKTRS